MSEFSIFVKSKMYNVKNLTLRELARRSGFDASYLSKVLADLVVPPQDIVKLRALAHALDINDQTQDFERFMDLAKIEAGKLPDYIIKNQEAMKSLPAFFRTIDKKKPSKEQLDKIMQILELE
ncbi:MAG: helix-turn-helix transcriptional regulator [Cyanobacteriota bacterium]